MRICKAISLSFVLIAMASIARAEVDPLPGSDESCAWISDLEGFPTAALEASEELPVECAGVLQCLIEARREAGLAEESYSTPEPNSICERLSPLVGLSKARALELAEAVPDELASPPRELSSLCKTFLTCVADSKAAGPSDEGPASEVSAASLKAEFDRICAQVSIASSLSPEQIRQLIQDCDNLSALYRSSGDPKAKLFLRRIEMCRSFFEYSLEVQELEGAQGEDP